MARTTRTAHTVARVAHTRGSPGSPGSLADLADPNLYAEKRPAQMKTDDAHFYLAVKKSKIWLPKPCFKEAPVGVYKLNTLMKTMSQKAGLGLNFKKPQQQKNYDSNFSQQRRSANGYYATNATTKNLKVSLELLYHRKKKKKKTAEHFSH